VRARETALHVSEKLGLEEVLRQRTAVDGHERTRLAFRQAVDVAGDDLLTRAALTGYENGGVGRRHHLRQAHNFNERAMATDRAARRVVLAPPDLALQRLVLRGELARFSGTPAQRHEIGVAERLLQVVERALVDGLHGGLQRCLRCHENDRDFDVVLTHTGEHLEASHARHADVGEHNVRHQFRQPRDGLTRVLHGGYVESLTVQQQLYRVENGPLVVDDQHAGHARHPLR
jgi:ribosome modulation factor